MLGDLGWPAGSFVLALLDFNLGVELGRLAVALERPGCSCTGFARFRRTVRG